jgi:hypothetical protein
LICRDLHSNLVCIIGIKKKTCNSSVRGNFNFSKSGWSVGADADITAVIDKESRSTIILNVKVSGRSQIKNKTATARINKSQEFAAVKSNSGVLG